MFTRNGPQQDLWLAELRLLSGIDDVAHHGQLTASAQLKENNVQHEEGMEIFNKAHCTVISLVLHRFIYILYFLNGSNTGYKKG